MTRAKSTVRRIWTRSTVGRVHATFVCMAIASMGLPARADLEPTIQYQWLLDQNPGWGTDGEWAFGVPQGLGGEEFGNPDPTSGYTGANVYGVNLYGDFANQIGGPYYLTVGPFDMTGVTGSSMRYWRWLNTDWLPWVSVKIQASNDNLSWVTLWENAFVEIADNAWNQWNFDTFAVADDQPTVWIRWSHQVHTGGTWAYSGWNVDDVELWGVATAPPVCPGDTDCDGAVGFADIDYFVAAIPDNEAAWSAYYAAQHGGSPPPCTFANGDTTGDGHVGFADIDPFVELIPSACP